MSNEKLLSTFSSMANMTSSASYCGRIYLLHHVCAMSICQVEHRSTHRLAIILAGITSLHKLLPQCMPKTFEPSTLVQVYISQMYFIGNQQKPFQGLKAHRHKLIKYFLFRNSALTEGQARTAEYGQLFRIKFDASDLQINSMT
jgi:hypothetical protein